MDAEREAVVDIAQRMTRPVIVQLRRGLIEAFKDGRKPDKVFAQARKQIENITNEGMLAAHVAATANTAQMIAKVRGIKLDRTALSPMMDRLKKIADLTGSDLNEIRARYAVRAADTSDDAIAAAQELIGSKAREIAAKGLGTRDGVSALREAMDSAGLGTQNPRLLETVYRTEFSVAYNGARLQANEAPELDEIIVAYQYVTVGDDRVRPTHAALDGATFAKNDPKWKTLAPPNGWNCRCSFIEILDNEDFTPNPPPKFTNDGGVKVPVVPDDGFGFNPSSIGRNISTGLSARNAH